MNKQKRILTISAAVFLIIAAIISHYGGILTNLDFSNVHFTLAKYADEWLSMGGFMFFTVMLYSGLMTIGLIVVGNIISPTKGRQGVADFDNIFTTKLTLIFGTLPAVIYWTLFAFNIIHF